jgi:D-glycero-D-manno-heptose 1,7-bisphosphate phosphatase
MRHLQRNNPHDQPKKAIFLDSDGVLNKAIIKNGKPAAPTSLSELEIPDEVLPSLDKLKAAGYLLICVTNKPDVERGLMTQEEVDAIYKKIRHDLPLDDVFICYSEDSACYKPKPGLLLEAAKRYSIDLAQSYMIGDRWRDIAAGQNAGCKTVWIYRGYAERKPKPPADYTAHSLMEAVDWILVIDLGNHAAKSRLPL